MLKKHKGAELVTVPRVGHAPSLDEPEALEAIKRVFGWGAVTRTVSDNIAAINVRGSVAHPLQPYTMISAITLRASSMAARSQLQFASRPCRL